MSVPRISEQMTKADAILAAVFEPRSINLKPFLLSLKKSGYKGEIIFFVTWASPQEIRELEGLGIRVERFRYFYYRKNNPFTVLWPIWQLMFRNLPTLHAKKRIAQYVFNMMCVRFVVYHDYLSTNVDRHANVLLTDARDVFFQDDPFRDFRETVVGFCLEDTRSTLWSNITCRKMIEETYGGNVARELGDFPIACAGTTLGPAAAILEYLNLMLEHLFSAKWMHRVCVQDQGVHNYLAHVTMRDRRVLFENGRGPVYTMGLCSEENFRFDDQGALLNVDGSVAPVLHQYDRFPQITNRLLKSLDQADPN